MTLSKSNIQYTLILLILAIAFCAYEFGYIKYIEKAAQVKVENENIEAEIAALQEKETHREEWESALASSKDEIKAVLAKYGPGNTPEKNILFIKQLEKAADMKIPSVSFSDETTIFASGDTDESGRSRVEMCSSTLSFGYTTTYKGLKDCMDFINGYSERMNVNGFSVSADGETGGVSGSMVINLYSIKDEDHIYEDPFISGVNLGTKNIFGK